MARPVSRSAALGNRACHSIYTEEGEPAIYWHSECAPERGWADDFDQLAFKGSPFIEEILFFHKKSCTVILDDLIQINPVMEGKPLQNALFKLDGAAQPYGGVPLDIRLAFTNRKLARRSLEKLLSWNFDKLIIAHGDCINRDAKPFVERAFHWLLR